MKTYWRLSVWVAAAVFSIGCLWGGPQQNYISLSENDLVRLIKQGSSPRVLVELVQKYGISFQPDEPTVDRLRKEGAPEALLNSIRNLRPAPQQKSPVVTIRQGPSNALEGIQHMRLGQLKAHNKDFEGALGEFAQAEKAIPNWEEVYYQRGLVLADLHRYADAAEEWKKYLTAAGAGADAKIVQAEIAKWEQQAQQEQSTRQGIEEAQAHLRDFHPDDAIGPLQKAVKSDPSLNNLLLLARAYWLKRDYASLSKVAAQALAADPNSVQALLYQGASQLGEEKTDTAISTFRRALALDPKSGFGYELLCDAYRTKQDMKNAVAACDVALKINPNSGFAHDRVGWILWYQRDFAGALEELRRATHAEPNNADWQADLAYGLLYQGLVPQASTVAQEALRLNPKSPFAHDAMGLVLDAQGDLEKAVLEFNEAIRLAPVGHPEFLDHLNKTMRKRKPGQ